MNFLKRLFFVGIFAGLLISNLHVRSQPGIGISYRVSQPQVPRPQISAPVTAINTVSTVSTVQRPGGTLTYGGVQYDGFVACTNGWLALVKPVANGGPATGSSIATMVGTAADNLPAPSTATGGGYPVIAPLWDVFTAANVGYSLQANVPGFGTNVWCIRWATCTWAGQTSNTFFVLINPANGTIRFVYESISAAVSAGSASVGMTGPCDGDYYSWASTGDVALTATAVSGNTATFASTAGAAVGMTVLNANTTTTRFTMSAAQTVANTLTFAAAPAGVTVGMYAYGPNIPAGTTVTAVAAAAPWTVTLSQGTTSLLPAATGISFSYYPPNTTVTAVTGTTLTLSNNAGGTFGTSSATFRLVNTRFDSTTTNNAIGSGTAFPRPGAPGINYYIDFTPNAPWNDGCAGTALSCTGANPNLGSISATCTPITWSIGSATASTSGNMSCQATDNKDVWFTVTKPVGVGTFIVRTSAASCGTLAGTSVEVFSGSCAALTLEGCATDNIAATTSYGEISIAGNCAVATTYYIRVTGDNNTVGKFNICCVSDATSGATCANAININSNGALPFNASCLSTSGRVNDYNNNGCNTGYAGEDLVFQYTAAGTECLTLTTSGGSGSNAGIFVFNGCPGTGSCVGYATSATTAVTLNVTVTAGTYYFIIDNTVGPMTNFSFSVSSSGTGPANDNPATATAVSVSPNCMMLVDGNTACASATTTCGANLATTTCGTYNANGDVWFTVTVPANGYLVINTQTGTVAPIMTDPVMALYTGTCGSFVEVACNDNTTGNFPSISQGGLIPGSTVYVRVWPKTGSVAGTFKICATSCTAPTNDNCLAATALTPAATCTYVTGNTFCAGNSAGVPAPSCGGTGAGDVWYSVVVPANGNVAVALAASGTAPAMTDAAMAIYSGTCAALTQIACNAGSPWPSISLTGQTAGTTLYIRVWPENGSIGGNFQICATSSCNSLDECASAGSLPFSSGATPTYYTFTNTCATTSTNTPGTSCVFTLVRDIWLTLTVPSGATQLTITCLVGTMTDPVLQVYTGSCGSLAQFACDNDAGPGLAPEITVCNITGGQTLYLRIFPYGGGTDGTFQIAAFDPGVAPANPYQADDPCTLVNINMPFFPVVAGCQWTKINYRCSTPTTNYAGIPAPTNCSPTNTPGWSPSRDVWVRVIVPPGITGMNFNTQSGTYNDDNMAIYRATNCSTMTQLACDDESASLSTGLSDWMPFISLGGLVPGETLYVRHYPRNGGVTQEGDFYFCVEAACSTTVTNDEACAAIALTVNSGCLYQGPYTNSCASTSLITPNPTCGSFIAAGATSSRDVWFRATVPPAGQLAIDIQGLTVADAAMAVYTATNCSTAFAQVGCDDNSSTNANMPFLNLTGLTPGATVYIRVWAKNGSSGTFNICVTDPCPLGTPPNDDPCNAIAMAIGTSYTGYNSCATNTTDPGMPSPTYPLCWTTGISNSVWYSFVAPSSSVNIVTTLGTLSNTQIALYSGTFCFSLIPFGSPTQLCNNDYLQCGVSTNASQIIATGLAPGQTYYIMLDGVQNLTGTFGITVYNAGTPLPTIPQQDCQAATVICSPQTTFGAPGFVGAGNYCDLGAGGIAYGCVPATGARENNSAWFAFNIDTTGLLYFDIFPSNPSANYDWVLWDITGSTLPGGAPNGGICAAITANTATIAACNYSSRLNFTTGSTGMGSQGYNSCTNCGTLDSAYSSPINVTAGSTYLLMINNTSGTASGFTIDFTNTPTVQYVASNPLNWYGGANSLWTNSQNWGGCGTPDCSIGATILPGLNQPTITGTETVNNLVIAPGASLNLAAGATLNVCGNFINNGTLNANPNSTVRFIGSGAQNISGNLTGLSRFGNLVIDRATSATAVTLQSTVEVGGNFSTANATSVLNVNNKKLRLYGNFTNAAGNTTITGVGSGSAGSTVEFVGTVNQVFTNNGSNLVLNNVIINLADSTLSVTLAPNPTSNLIIGAGAAPNTGGNLTLTRGKVITGTANEVIVQNTAGSSVNFGSTKSFVEGWLRRYFGTTAGATYEFPVGDALYGFERATIQFTAAPTSPYQLAMRFLRWGGSNLPLVTGPPPPPLECANYQWDQRNALNHGYWNCTTTGTPTGTYNLTLWNLSQTNYSSSASYNYPTSGQTVLSNQFTITLPCSPGAGCLAVAPTVGMYVVGNRFASVGQGIPITGVTGSGAGPYTITLAAPTRSLLPAGELVNFFTAGGIGTSRFDALTVMKDTTTAPGPNGLGTGGWKMEGICPCNNTYPPPVKPNSMRYAINAATSGFSNFATVQYSVTLGDSTIPCIGLAADASPSNSVVCLGGTASITVSASGGQSPYTGTGVFVRPAGTYSFTVADSYGCTSVKSVTVTENLTTLGLTSSYQPISCKGGTTAVTIAATGGTAPFTGLGTFVRGAGTYTFTVTDASGCVNQNTVTLTEPAAILPNVTLLGYTCAGDSVDLLVSASGGTSPYTGTGTKRFRVGADTVRVTDNTGCQGVLPVNYPARLLVTASITPVTCAGGMNGLILLAESPDTSGNAGANPGMILSELHTNPPGDDSPFEWVELIATDRIDFSQRPFTVIFSNNGKATTKGWLQGGVATSLVNSTYAFQIDTGSVIPGDVVYVGGSQMQPTGRKLRIKNTASQSGDGSLGAPNLVTGVLGNGGGIADGVAVFNKPVSQLDSNSIPVDAIFFGSFIGDAALVDTSKGFTLPVNDRYQGGHLDSADFKAADPLSGYLSASGAFNASSKTYTTARNWSTSSGYSNSVSSVTVTPRYSYSWSNGSTSKDLSQVAAGNYTVTVTSGSGCTATYTYNIPSPTVTQANVTADSIRCQGDSSQVIVSASGGVPPYTGIGTFRVPAGNYSYVVTDANGCTSTARISLSQSVAPLAVGSSVNPVLCYGSTGSVQVNASGGTPPYTGTGVFIRSSGTYTFTVSDARGCQSSVTASLPQPSSLVVSAQADSVACFQGFAPVAVTASGGTPPYSGTGVFQSQAGYNSFLVSDASGCQDTAEIQVYQPSAPLLAQSTSVINYCNGSSIVIHVTASGGTPPYAGLGSFSVNGGTYTYSVSDARQCTATTQISVPSIPGALVAVVSITTPVLCYGDSGIISVTATGGNPPYQGIGNYYRHAGTYSFLVTDSAGCTASQTITLSQPSPLSLSTQYPDISCFGGNTLVTVSATGGTTPYTGTGSFTRSAGNQTFLVSDASGCSAMSSIQISQPSPLQLNSVNSPTICYGYQTGSIDLTVQGGTPPYQYAWSDGSSDQDIDSLSAGVYTVIVTDHRSCQASIVDTVIQGPPFLISGISPNVSNQGVTIAVGGQGFLPVSSVSFSGSPATFTVLSDTVINTVVPVNAPTGPLSLQLYNGCRTTSSQSFTYLNYYADLELKVVLEGYNDFPLMVPANVNRGVSYSYDDVDTLRAYLIDPIDPTLVVDSAKAVLDIFGVANFRFSGTRVGNPYYLLVKSLNTLATYSAEPVMMSISTQYDFTDAASKAYGGNMREVLPGLWAFYTGDINQDLFIDSFDFPEFNDQILLFLFGYSSGDLNGDGYVDNFDYPLYQSNSINFVLSIGP